MPRKPRITTSQKVTPESDRSYMDRLEFDPRLMVSAVAKYISNLRLVMLLVLTILLLGLVSYTSLPKRLNPEVNIAIVSVVTFLPGASPEDIESLVTVPLENELRSAEGLDQITSVSNENVSVITLQYLSQVSSDEAKNEVQSLVDGVNDLPDDAVRPQVTALDFEDQPIWTFAVTTQGDPRTLMTFAEELKIRIEELSKVDRVDTSGFEDQEVVVTLNLEKVQEYGINPLLLAQSIQKSVNSYPAGSIETTQNAFSLTINPSLTTIEDLRQLRVNLMGEVYVLGDIASISEQPKARQQIAFLASREAEPERAVTFYVYKTSSSNIDEAALQAEAKVEELSSRYGETYTLTSLSNTNEQITEQFADLLAEFRTTIILVFICLLVFLGLRQAVISSLTVPLTFLSAFIFMNILGMSINFLSLFAFLLALGLLVDDTIVVVSAMTAYHKTGKFTPMQTGLLVWRDTIVPIWSTTLTTIWSFVPLLLTSGIIGEFIKPIPIVVTVTMISSTAIAVLITLPIMILILKPRIPGRVMLLLKFVGVVGILGLVIFFLQGNPLLPVIGSVFLLLLTVVVVSFTTLKKRIQTFFGRNKTGRTILERARRISDHGIINLEGFSQRYYNITFRMLSSKSARHKIILAITVYAIAGFMLLPLGLVKNEFFPKTDAESVVVGLELPAGTNSVVTEQETLRLLEQLKITPEVDFVTAEIGRGVASGFGGSSNAQNISRFTLHLPKRAERDSESYEIAEEIRETYKGYTAGSLSVVEESGGPPAGAEIQIELLGPNLDQLNVYADTLSEYLKTQPGTINIDKSYQTGTTQLVFVPDQNKVAAAGLSVDQIGLALRMYASGFTLDSINLNPIDAEKEDVVFKFSNSLPDPAGLGTVSVTTQTGTNYPLLSLGQLVTRANPTSVTRKNGTRTVTVTAAVAPGFTASDINTNLAEAAGKIDLENGYSWQTGGVNEENQKSINSILQAMLISVVLILITMVVQFNSFRQAFIVLIVIPLAVSSVFWIFALTGTPLSFPALIGVLSLFGIVVTNSMFIVDKINLNLKQGMKLKESIADAGASRLEPIILTKLSTVLGLLPITIADPLWRGLGGAIISGLLIASTIMLLFIPAIYYSFFQKSYPEPDIATS